MDRRKFLRMLLLGSVFTFFSKKVKAIKRSDRKLKEAMFWRRAD
jgi:hypothetical protein